MLRFPIIKKVPNKSNWSECATVNRDRNVSEDAGFAIVSLAQVLLVTCLNTHCSHLPMYLILQINRPFCVFALYKNINFDFCSFFAFNFRLFFFDEMFLFGCVLLLPKVLSYFMNDFVYGKHYFSSLIYF